VFVVKTEHVLRTRLHAEICNPILNQAPVVLLGMVKDVVKLKHKQVVTNGMLGPRFLYSSRVILALAEVRARFFLWSQDVVRSTMIQNVPWWRRQRGRQHVPICLYLA
jgi:hypothetical protein